jgi:hypothetical protein
MYPTEIILLDMIFDLPLNRAIFFFLLFHQLFILDSVSFEYIISG